MIASLYMLFNFQRSTKAIFLPPKYANIVRMQEIFQTVSIFEAVWKPFPTGISNFPQPSFCFESY